MFACTGKELHWQKILPEYKLHLQKKKKSEQMVFVQMVG